ncbi:MalY/PatB family protein [Congregicoccus parvus]|uniref:MalY/PatB family protein n=1 Tax=Congregicoccus parvus TaxID=3081749 RepID=UPI003FA5C605
MPYDFSSIVSRHGTDSQKWQKYRGRNILPMWVADMDFHVAPEIVAAVHARADDAVYGYCRPTDSTIASVVDYLRRSFDWRVEVDWLVWLPGLVPAINLACRAVGERGDAVATLTPVYPPFLSAPRLAERRLIASDLVLRNGRWEIDWERLEASLTPDTRLFLLCHPHNPVGRVWRRDELERIADLCLRHDLVLCSDEIHCDLILDDLPHVPTGTLGSEIAARTITLLAPSKTYNIAGLGCSFAVISDSRLRTRFKNAGMGVLAEVNNFGYAACEAAYRHGEPWRQALLRRLRANRDIVETTIASGALPGVSMAHIEATYLAWLDVSALGLEDPVAFFEAGGVGLSGGTPFGDPRHVRLNYGCPEETLREGLARMQASLARRA